MLVCVFIAKLLGVIWVIPITPLIGKDGLGIYSNAYNIYTILQQLATSGFPLAMGKLISERLAHKRYAEVEQIYRTTFRSLTVFGILAFLLMWFGAPWYAALTAVQDAKQAAALIVPSVRALSFLLLIVPFMSGLRGYLQGFQMFDAPAYSQAIEQLFRVIAMVAGVFIVVRGLHHSYPAGAAAATFGAVVGGLAGLILLWIAVRPMRRQYGQYDPLDSPLTSTQALRMVYRVALPISLGGLVQPLAGLADNFTVQNLLMSVGESLKEATGNYGILTRQAIYLVQLPLAFVYAIGASVLPAIAEAHALRRQSDVQSTVIHTFRTTFFLSFPTAAVLLVLANPINYVLVHSYEGASIVAAISFMSIFSSLELISTYMLQGLGKMYRPVRNMFIGVFIKLILNVVLIMAMHSVMGAAIASTIGYLFSSALNVLAVKKYGRVHFRIIRLALPFFLASLPLVAALYGGEKLFGAAVHPLMRISPWTGSLIQLLLTTALGAAVYLYVSIRIGAIREDELRRLPRIGGRLARIAQRIYRPRRRQVQSSTYQRRR